MITLRHGSTRPEPPEKLSFVRAANDSDFLHPPIALDAFSLSAYHQAAAIDPESAGREYVGRERRQMGEQPAP
jgi:hypothetical protein